MFFFRLSTGLLCQILWISTVCAIKSESKWSSVFSTTLYDALPACAQPCVAGVDSSLSCWSYGCVCSESSPGANFVDGTRYIQKCVRERCPELGEGTVNNALNAFQNVCNVPYFFGLGSGTNGSTTVTATITATLSATAVVTPSAEPITNPILIDRPAKSYDKLSPCLRWVLNNCTSPRDNAENCKPDKPGDHRDVWTGLGRHLQCSTTECVCSGMKFSYSLQKFYERADLYCSVGFPYRGADAQQNEGFKTTIKMLADFCSTEGFIIGEWVINVYGLEKEKGLSAETKTSIGVGVGSAVLTIISIVVACIQLRKP